MPDVELMLLVPSLDTGGTERQVVLLLRGLVDARPDLVPRTVLVTMLDGGALAGDIPSGIRIVALGRRRIASPAIVWAFARLLRRERPQVVYSLLAPANLLAALTAPVWNARRVWGHRSQHYSLGASARSTKVVATLLRWGSRTAAGVIANSSAAAGYLAAIGVRRPWVKVIENAVDTTQFQNDDAAGVSARAELGIPASTPLLLSVGRLVADKDHPTLLRAIAHVMKELPDARLALVGGGDAAAMDALRHLATALGIDHACHFLGARHDLQRWYNAADLVVQSSRNEGSSNVVLEALAVGRPIVSTDCGDAAVRLPADRIVPIGDDVALAAAVVASLHGSLSPMPVNDVGSIHQLALDTLRALGLAESHA